MITLNASGSSVIFTFSGNSTYLNDGTIEVPKNSLALIIDESDMATFRKAASNDIFVSANIAEFGMTKDELMAWYKANMVSSSGGGGSDTVDGTSLFCGIHYANEGTSAKLFSKMFEGQKPSALKFVVGNGNNTYSSAITITLYDTDYNVYPNTMTISSSGGAVTSITEANGGSFTGITVDSDWVLRPSEGYFFNSYQWLISNYGLGLRISPKDGIIESGSTTDVIENGIYKQLQRHEENIGNLALSAVTSTELSFKDESGITLTTNASSSALAVDNSLKYNGKLGVYVTGDTYTTNLNSESATTYLMLDGIKNVDMWLNQSYTGTPSGWYTIFVQNLDNANDYYLYENNAFTFVLGTAGSTLNYDSSTGKLSITCPSGISSINNTWKFAPKDDLTNADCFIGLVSYTSNEYTIQDAIDNKQDTLIAGENITISGNVISATGQGGGCEVEETVVYDRLTQNYYDGWGDKGKLTYTLIDYLGDKTTADNIAVSFEIGNTNDSYNGWIYFDYVNHSASTDSLSDYTTVEYITETEYFKVSVASAYQSTCWIKNIQNLDSYKNALIPFYTINSGSPCTVITTDVVGLVTKVKDKAYEAINICNFTSQADKMSLDIYHIDGRNELYTIKFEELDGSNNTLKPNIQVGLGVSGWTSIDIGGMAGYCSNCSSQDIGALVHRLTYSYDEQTVDYSNLCSYFQIGLKAYGSEWYSDTQYIDFVESGSTYVPSIRSQIFDGLEPTLDWDAATKKLIVTYPATYTHPNDIYGFGTYDVVVKCVGSDGCHMGTEDLLSGIEYYAEQIQPLKPYVQETRAALGGLSLVKLTKAEYDALATKDDNTLYVVIPNP